MENKFKIGDLVRIKSGLTEDETNVFCSDLENIEYTTNEKQTFLFIQRIDKGVLFENNLDTKYSDETELKKNYKRVISDGTNIIKIVGKK